jgi:hypothetical protein
MVSVYDYCNRRYAYQQTSQSVFVYYAILNPNVVLSYLYCFVDKKQCGFGCFLF